MSLSDLNTAIDISINDEQNHYVQIITNNDINNNNSVNANNNEIDEDEIDEDEINEDEMDEADEADEMDEMDEIDEADEADEADEINDYNDEEDNENIDKYFCPIDDLSLIKDCEQICSICCELLIKNKTCKLGCEHIFHVHCIKQWLNKKINCPECREDCMEWKKNENKFVKLTKNYFYFDTLNHTESRSFHISSFSNLDGIGRITAREYYEITGSNDVELFNNYLERVLNSAHSPLPLPRVEWIDAGNNEIRANRVGSTETIIIKQEDIELVASQADCSYEDAVRGLMNNNLDIVNAIMELTM